ncbi:MAG TPA: hypothetical protein PLH11_06410 [Gemmobacter sp.]|nr:hypothetical protein [Gemmobacter sp.]
MSLTLATILRPVPAELTPLDRRGFLRELALAMALSLGLPLVLLIAAGGLALGMAPWALAIFIFGGGGLVGVVMLIYAMLRLNTATLAREVAMAKGAALPLEPTTRRWSWNGFIPIGTAKSHKVSQVPITLGWGLVYTFLAQELVLPLHLPWAALLIWQALALVKLLR